MASRKVNINMPNLNDLNLEVRVEGEWTTLDRLGNNLLPSVQRGYEKGVSSFAKKLLAIVKRSIATGIPPPGSNVRWQELSPEYEKRYGKHPIYHLTGLYFRTVDVFSYKSRTLIGLPLNKRRSGTNGITMNQLAVLLEYGSRLDGSYATGHIPPRPVWAPSIKSAGGPNALKKELLLQIRRQLATDCGVHARQVR